MTTLRIGCAVATAATTLFAAWSAGAQNLIQFNRNDPEIQAFRARSPGGESSAAGTRMPPLSLPVLDFKQPPVAGLGGFESTAAARPAIPIFRASDPTGYSVRHVYPGVVIEVSGELKISGEQSVPGAAPATGIVVQPADPANPEEQTGYVTVHKYGIPYVISVSCEEARVSLCRSETQLRTMAERLGLISVPQAQ